MEAEAEVEVEEAPLLRMSFLSFYFFYYLVLQKEETPPK